MPVITATTSKRLFSIDQKILPNLHSKVLKQAETRLDDDGLHPAWGEADSIFNLIPRADMEVK